MVGFWFFIGSGEVLGKGLATKPRWPRFVRGAGKAFQRGVRCVGRFVSFR